MDITVTNGSASNIQAAESQVRASGGGKVIIPAGTYNLNGSVEIGTNVSLVGAGRGLTILNTQGENMLIKVVGTGVKVSDISLVSSTWDGFAGIHVESYDFRIHDCDIEGYGYAGILVDHAINRGLIDNCFFKSRVITGLGYGVAVIRSNQYDPNPSFGTKDCVFIEDCDFEGARHAITASQGAKYVARHNYMHNCVVGQPIDAHGKVDDAQGTSSFEIYNNLIEMPGGGNMGIGIRGGSGVIFNNIVNSYQYGVILMVESDQVGMPYPVEGQIHNTYIWGNIFNTIKGGVVVASTPDSSDYVQLNREYFLASKPGYTPYPYPHPMRDEVSHTSTMVTIASSFVLMLTILYTRKKHR